MFATSLLVANGCSGDSGEVSFDPIDGATNARGGSKPSAGTSAGGSSTLAGSSSGGSTGQAGTKANGGNAGNAEAGTSTGTSGTGTSGTGAGGTDVGEGGTAGDGGSENTSGTSGGGMAGTAGGGAGGAGAGGGGTGGAGAGGGGTGGAGAGGGGAGGGPTCAPKTEICDGLDNDCDKVADQGQTCPAGCTGATYGGHTYAFCGVVESGTAAFTRCQNMALGVVMIESAGENAFVTSSMKGSSWLGATDAVMEGRWTWYHNGTVFWNDKKPVDGRYQNWSAGNPNDANLNGLPEDCAVILAGGATKGQWNDLNCDFKIYSATCESLDPLP